MENGILNEGAVEEFEILEFKAGGNSYGVNVSDIREILPYNKKATPVPNAHSFIEGIIMPREFLIPVINLTKSLNLNKIEHIQKEMLIVTGINDLNIAFHVDSVNGIHRIHNSEIMKPGNKLTTLLKDVVVGVLSREDNKIEILDLRKIMDEINPETLV